uniref:Uncharacterized protein n=1 Tax=Anopheles albimanus TaxID=7167 RepID=A0A182F6B6_ANOAL
MASRVYMPLPGPPAENEPPPPIIMFNTQAAMKSLSWWEHPRSPITTSLDEEPFRIPYQVVVRHTDTGQNHTVWCMMVSQVGKQRITIDLGHIIGRTKLGETKRVVPVAGCVHHIHHDWFLLRAHSEGFQIELNRLPG